MNDVFTDVWHEEAFGPYDCTNQPPLCNLGYESFEGLEKTDCTVHLPILLLYRAENNKKFIHSIE